MGVREIEIKEQDKAQLHLETKYKRNKWEKEKQKNAA